MKVSKASSRDKEPVGVIMHCPTFAFWWRIKQISDFIWGPNKSVSQELDGSICTCMRQVMQHENFCYHVWNKTLYMTSADVTHSTLRNGNSYKFGGCRVVAKQLLKISAFLLFFDEGFIINSGVQQESIDALDTDKSYGNSIHESNVQGKL